MKFFLSFSIRLLDCYPFQKISRSYTGSTPPLLHYIFFLTQYLDVPEKLANIDYHSIETTKVFVYFVGLDSMGGASRIAR